MSDTKEYDDTCAWDASEDAPEIELCCCYVEQDDGSYENPCAQAYEECCC